VTITLPPTVMIADPFTHLSVLFRRVDGIIRHGIHMDVLLHRHVVFFEVLRRLPRKKRAVFFYLC